MKIIQAVRLFDIQLSCLIDQLRLNTPLHNGKQSFRYLQNIKITEYNFMPKLLSTTKPTATNDVVVAKNMYASGMSLFSAIKSALKQRSNANQTKLNHACSKSVCD